MTVIASISARKGSKGVPGKNLRKVGSKSLIERSITLAKKTLSIDFVFFSSDSKEMVEIAQSLGAIAELRPAKLADDHTSLHMVTKYNLGRIRTKICEPKCIVQLAPTCPFLRESTLNKGIKKVLNENYTSAIGLQRIEHSHPYRARVLDGDGSFRNFIRDVDVEAPKFHSRQDLPELWSTCGGIYIRNIQTMDEMDGSTFGFGERPYALCIDEIEAVNIDNLVDYEFACFLAEKHSI